MFSDSIESRSRSLQNNPAIGIVGDATPLKESPVIPASDHVETGSIHEPNARTCIPILRWCRQMVAPQPKPTISNHFHIASVDPLHMIV